MSSLTRTLIPAVILLALVATASAYIITIEAPETVTTGSPVIITGNTTFPEDTYFDLVLFYSKYTAGEVSRQKVFVDSSKQFRTDFDTRTLEKGQYKVEVHNIISDGKGFVESALGSASVIRRVIMVVNRSDEIITESPISQDMATALTVTGRIKDMENGVITLRVFGPDGFTFGPQQVITKTGFADKDGHFSTQIPVSLPGEYQVSISDKSGFIGEIPFTVTSEATTESQMTTPDTPAPTITNTPLPTPQVPVDTPTPSPTRSPVSMGILIGAVIIGGISSLRR